MDETLCNQQHPMITATERKSKIWSVVRVSSGNFLEMYELHGVRLLRRAHWKAFFPSSRPFASLMLSLMTFGAGFFDASSRGSGSSSVHRPARAPCRIASDPRLDVRRNLLDRPAMPGYATIGLLAPLLVLVGRLLQGFSAGMELGGVSVYLSEIATPGHKGFYVSWQSGSQQIAVIFAASIGVVLNGILPPEKMEQWGWRVPLLIGCIIVPFMFKLRKSLAETDEFVARKNRPSTSEILRSLSNNWRIVLVGTFMVTMTTVSFYMITAYTPTFGNSVLHLGSTGSLIVTLCVGASNLFWLPVMGSPPPTVLGADPYYSVALRYCCSRPTRQCSGLFTSLRLAGYWRSNCGCRSFMAATTVRWSSSDRDHAG